MNRLRKIYASGQPRPSFTEAWSDHANPPCSWYAGFSRYDTAIQAASMRPSDDVFRMLKVQSEMTGCRVRGQDV